MLRELRADLLPGHSFWTSEAAAPIPAAGADVYAVGQAATKSGPKGANKNKAPTAVPEPAKPTATAAAAPASAKAVAVVPNTCGSVTLKKAGLRWERGLVVELLKDTQARTRPPAGAFRVWVQELLNPGAKEVMLITRSIVFMPLRSPSLNISLLLLQGNALVSPSWPPKQALINGGVAPTLGHLKRAVASALTQVPTDTMCVYKYLPSYEWSPVIYAGAGANTKNAKGGKKGESNITQGPHFVKEGDQFCAFDSKTVRLAPGVIAEVDGIVKFALPEDIQLRILRENERAERKLKKQYKSVMFDAPNGGNTVVPRGARKEVMLSLGSGFDFSDDEN